MPKVPEQQIKAGDVLGRRNRKKLFVPSLGKCGFFKVEKISRTGLIQGHVLVSDVVMGDVDAAGGMPERYYPGDREGCLRRLKDPNGWRVLTDTTDRQARRAAIFCISEGARRENN